MENGHAEHKAQALVNAVDSAQTKKEKKDLLSRAQSGVLEAINKRKEVDFRASHTLLIAFFALLLILKVIGIYLFTSGFLLTRLVLEDKSECAIPPADIGESYVAGSYTKGCWHPKTFDKAVVIIIDALRYDFTVPFQATTEHTTPRAFHDMIPVFYDTAVSHPENAVLLPFIADPPTTTLQRLKGLTTGTLPTFIDAGSNFAGTAIDEDNLVMQAVKANKTIVHLGDDTWQSLFPGYFDEELTKPFDSFNVWDLHTVDNGVSHHLMPLLHPSNVTRWDLLFAHYLGVDHAGHRYGPDHPAMKAKLAQMDAVVRQAMDLIDDRTVLIVMGDHGMDSKGDHGGESDDEVEAALWMYSKAKAFGRSSKSAIQPPPTAKERPVNQIDLVPTLAYLLGLPVPFNNLGTPIEEAFIGPDGRNYANLASVNRITSAQIRNYQREYAQIRKPDAAAMALPDHNWEEATKLWHDLTSTWSTTTPKQFDVLARAFLEYQSSNLRVCKDLWARFDLTNMAMGIFVLAFALILTLIFARGMQGDITALSSVFFIRGLVGLAAGVAFGAALGLIAPFVGLIRSTAFAAALFCCLAIAIQLQIFRDRLKSIFPRSIWSWACIVSVVMLSAGFGSNSYTIWEDEITLFFLGFFAILMLSAIFRLPGSTDRTAGYYHVAAFMLSLRLASLSRLCRDEQMPYCRSTYYASSTSSTSAPWQLIISWLVALILPSLIKAYYKRTQSYQGSAQFWIGVAFRICLFLIAVFWTLEVADDGEWFANVPVGFLKTVRVYIAQLVLATSVAAGGATFAYQAPYIAIETIPTQDQQSPGGQKNKATSTASTAADSQPQLIVHGTSNLYGSHYATLPLTVILIPLLLVSKPMGQAALSFTVITLLSLFEIFALLQRVPRAIRASPNHGVPSTSNFLRLSASPSSQADTITTVLAPTILAFLAHFTFFKTGHQAVLASMQWDAAFIALHTVRYPWSVLLVVLNTCAGQILCAAAVPAVVLWRRPHRFLSGANDAESEATLKPSVGSATGANVRERNANRAAARRNILSACARAALTHGAVYAVLNLATTIFAGHLRRHLMLYRVFSPRWMMGIVGVAIVDIVLCAVSLVGAGRSIGAVSGVFGW